MFVNYLKGHSTFLKTISSILNNTEKQNLVKLHKIWSFQQSSFFRVRINVKTILHVIFKLEKIRSSLLDEFVLYIFISKVLHI